jgi:alcohol dehydrogenase
VNYTYSNPVKIRMGRGSLKGLGEILAGRTAVLVTTPGMVKRGVTARIESLCGNKLLKITSLVEANPTFETIEKSFGEVREYDYDVIIGLGGGSALDTAKGVALLCTGSFGPNGLRGYLESPAKKLAEIKARPIIAIPTTSGSGSEVTKWATVWEGSAKYSISADVLYPEWALLDPELTDTLPYEATLFCALDALSHAMEAIWNRNANPVSDLLATGAISLSVAILSDDFKQRHSLREVRDVLQRASLFAGLAFSNTKTALAHSISYPLTSNLKLPHGLAAGFTLPEVMRVNHCRDNRRVGTVIKAMGCKEIDEAVERLYDIFVKAGVPDSLKGYLPNPDDLDRLGGMLISPERAGNNLADVTEDGALQILRASFSRLTEC